MKYSRFSLAALVAGFASSGGPVWAQDGGGSDWQKLSGYLGVHYSWIDLDIRDINSVGGYARISAPLGGSGFNVQLDGHFDHLHDDLDSLNFTEFTLHGFWRGPVYAAGLFSGYSSFEGDLDSWYIGAEGQYYFDRATLYAQVSYDRIDLLGTDVDHYYGRLVGRYFATDNVKLEAEFGYGQASASGTEVDQTSIGALAEYRFDQWPVGLFGQYYLSHYDFGPADYEVHDFRIGGRIYFGSDSLIDNDRNGTSLDIRPVATRIFN